MRSIPGLIVQKGFKKSLVNRTFIDLSEAVSVGCDFVLDFGKLLIYYFVSNYFPNLNCYRCNYRYNAPPIYSVAMTRLQMDVMQSLDQLFKQ